MPVIRVYYDVFHYMIFNVNFAFLALLFFFFLFGPCRTADIALIGLAVMGQNLILNMDEKGFVVCAYNRTVSKVNDFLNNEAKGTKVIGADSLKDMVAKLKAPRKVMLLVKGELLLLFFLFVVNRRMSV